MKTTAKTYAILVSAIGFCLALYCVHVCVDDISQSVNGHEKLIQYVMLFILAYICRCLPVYIREDFAIDMAFISNIAIILFLGPFAAVAITLATSIFIVEHISGPKNKIITIYNTPFIKTAFNTGNLCISVYTGGLMFEWVGGVIGDLSFPGIILPLLAMIFTIMSVNSILLILLFKLNTGIPFFKSFVSNLADFMPSVIAAAPIGYFIAEFMGMENGEYLVILFVLPLLLARYAFLLYISSKQNYYVMLKTLTLAIEAKDEYTCGHSQRVEEYAKQIAMEMHLSRARIEKIQVAALLHDIGKIGIDESILNKPAKLTPVERKQIETHPQISMNILKEVELPEVVLQMILHHHERFDGRGYPSGMGGDSLPIEVYILGVADTYDAITSTRPYSYGSSPERAKEIIMEERGLQFHPVVVEAFLRAFEKGNMTLVKRASNEMLSV